MKHQFVENEPATESVFWIVMSLLTVASTLVEVVEVEPNPMTPLDAAVAAAPLIQNVPLHVTPEFAPAAPIVRNTSTKRNCHGSAVRLIGVVCATDAPSATPPEPP